MKTLPYLSLLVLATGLATTSANAFEMRRISVADGTVHRCIVSNDKLVQETVVDGVTTDVKSDLTTDVATLDNLVTAVPEGFRDDVPQAQDHYTNWWVRNDGQHDFRMIRSSVLDSNGKRQAYQEPSQASQKLAVILGTICGFGPHN